MKLARMLPLVGLFTALAGPASAQVNDFRFLAGSGVGGLGTQVGAYKAQLGDTYIDIFCVDFLNHVSIGDQYRVNVTTLAGSPSLSNTRFGNLDTYQQAAWLASQFYREPPLPTSEWASLHAAIWQLTSPGTPSVSPSQQLAVDNWRASALANYQNYYYDNVQILSDVAIGNCRISNPGAAPWTGCGHQEHIFVDGGRLTATPEPASMALLATGLVGLGAAGFVKRRRERRQS